MAATGIFVGFPRKAIEKVRNDAFELLTQGKTIMTYTDGSTSAGKQFTMPPLQMLQEANYALLRLDGRTRGLYTNYNRLVDR